MVAWCGVWKVLAAVELKLCSGFFLFTHCRPIRLRQPAPSSDCRFSNGQGFSTARIHMVRAPDGRRCIRCVELATHAVHIRTPPDPPAASACLIGRHTVRRRGAACPTPAAPAPFGPSNSRITLYRQRPASLYSRRSRRLFVPGLWAIVRTLLLFPSLIL